MAKGILGKKIGMTQVFADKGTVVPVTVIEAGPCVVLQRKELETDGYEAIQLGFSDKKEIRSNKPEKGHATKANTNPKRYIRELREIDVNEYEVGQEVNADIFESGEHVDVSAISKGKGFSGSIKRHNYSRGPMTHGSHHHRSPGSLGAVDPMRVFKGKPLPGRMGTDKVTIQHLEVVRVDTERNLILIKGSIPGPKNGFVTIQKSVKS